MASFTSPRKKGDKAPPHPIFGHSIANPRPPPGVVVHLESPKEDRYVFGPKG